MTTIEEPPAKPVGKAPSRSNGALPAAIMLLGTLVSLYGLTWDIYWHIGVGVDSFFTLPHLLVYSGAAITGVASLVMVLRVTAAQRHGVDPDPAVGGRSYRALGRFAAPLGYLVGGISSAGFLLYGLFDEWWHGLYGFDVTIASPPHQGWLHSVSMTMVGTAIVFAAARRHWWGRLGALTALVMYAMYASIATSDLNEMIRGFGIQWSVVAAVLLPVLVIMVASQFLGWKGALIASALTMGLNLVMTVAALWAVGWYADYLGLSLREGMSTSFSPVLVLGSLVVGIVGLLLALVQRWIPLTGWMLGLYAVIAAMLTGYPTLLVPGGGGGMGGGTADEPNVVLTLVMLGLFAFFLGWATWRLGRALRTVDTAPPAPSRAVEVMA